MEFQFRKEYATGNVSINMSMGHEAFATWLEQEGLSVNWGNELQKLIQGLLDRESHAEQLIGREFTLYLSSHEVQVKHNSLLAEDELFEAVDDDALQLYEQELQAECGLEDFELFISSWLAFIT